MLCVRIDVLVCQFAQFCPKLAGKDLPQNQNLQFGSRCCSILSKYLVLNRYIEIKGERRSLYYITCM